MKVHISYLTKSSSRNATERLKVHISYLTKSSSPTATERHSHNFNIKQVLSILIWNKLQQAGENRAGTCTQLAQLAACPHQQIFSKFYLQSVYVVCSQSSVFKTFETKKILKN